MAREAPLRRELLASLLLLVLLSLGGGVASYFITARISDRVYDHALLEVADELTLHLSMRDGAPDLSLSPAAARLLVRDQPDEISFRISTKEGGVVGGDPAVPLPPARRMRETGPVFYHGRLDGDAVSVVLIRRVVPGDPNATPVLVQVAETRVKRGVLARNIVIGIVLPQFLLIVVASLLVWSGVGRKLSALRKLQQAVENRSHLDLSPIVEDRTPPDVRPLLQALNGLMLRLDKVLTFQTRFIADAAHQLRTPVAGLKTNLEVALRETDAQALRQSLQQMYRGVDRLSRLVSQLLSLARNDPSSSQPPDFAPLDLNRMILNLTTEWVPEAYRRQIDLGFEGPEGPVFIEGSALRLAELANNLIDNAIRYSRNGGRVTVRVDGSPRPSLSVSDDGPRIPAEERERIFERFHRVLGTQADGSGLGLAIVREIAALHHAEVILADDTDGVGNCFTIQFAASGRALSQSMLRGEPAL